MVSLFEVDVLPVRIITVRGVRQAGYLRLQDRLEVWPQSPLPVLQRILLQGAQVIVPWRGVPRQARDKNQLPSDFKAPEPPNKVISAGLPDPSHLKDHPITLIRRPRYTFVHVGTAEELRYGDYVRTDGAVETHREGD